jgi:hypothetical protein
MKEAIATQILLGLLLGHYVVFINGVSLKSEGGTWGGSLVSYYYFDICFILETSIVGRMHEVWNLPKIGIDDFNSISYTTIFTFESGKR